MTIRERLRAYLEQNGLMGKDVDGTMKIIEEMQPSMTGRWEDDEKAYPEMMIRSLRIDANEAAIKWIDENKPRHFARRMFQ